MTNEIMNVSIDWPVGRGDRPYYLDESAQSADEGTILHMCTAPMPLTQVTPHDLAPARKRDWPQVYPAITDCHLFEIYTRVHETGLPNMIGLRLPVPSMLNFAAWHSVATGHADDLYVLDGIKFGFPLHYVGPALLRENRDAYSSAKQYWSHVQHYVRIESQNKAMLGPFESPPFLPWTNISPVMTRPKAGSAKRRVIVDLSFPDGDNVNAYVHKNMILGCFHEHRLPLVRDTIAVIEDMDYEVKLGTLDIERAYRNIPVCPLDLPLLGIKIAGKIYIDAAMPFGARNSSLNMQLIAQFIVWALQARGVTCQMYLDDMVVQLSPYQDFHSRFAEIMALYRALGLPISYSKLQTPADTITYLGIHIDVPSRLLSWLIRASQEAAAPTCTGHMSLYTLHLSPRPTISPPWRPSTA